MSHDKPLEMTTRGSRPFESFTVHLSAFIDKNDDILPRVAAELLNLRRALRAGHSIRVKTRPLRRDTKAEKNGAVVQKEKREKDFCVFIASKKQKWTFNLYRRSFQCWQ